MTIKITLLDDNHTSAPLYAQYDGQLLPQSAYLQFDPAYTSLELEAAYSGEIGNGVPVDVWNRQVLHFGVSSNVARSAITGLADNSEVEALLKTIHLGYQDKWDGSNFVGRYSAEAESAIERMDQICLELNTVDVWEAKDWLCEGMSMADVAKHQSIEAAAAEFKQEAESESDYIAVFGGFDEAVAEIAADRIHNSIEDEDVDQNELIVMDMLIAYDADEYSYLADDYNKLVAG